MGGCRSVESDSSPGRVKVVPRVSILELKQLSVMKTLKSGLGSIQVYLSDNKATDSLDSLSQVLLDSSLWPDLSNQPLGAFQMVIPSVIS